MKIFLTGSSGYLGSNIYKNISAEYFLYRRGSNILDDLLKFKPDFIIHSAGEIYDKEKMFDSNVVLTNDILQYVKNNNIIKMIYLGTSSEYGKCITPMAETDTTDPFSIYAATKSCGTLLCQAYAREFDKDICILRPFSVYGSNEPMHRLIPTIVSNIHANKSTTLIHGFHDFIYIKDFIKLIYILLNSDKIKTKADIINCGSGRQTSNREIFDLICGLISIPNNVIEIDKKKECDSEMWICDIEKNIKKYNFNCDYILTDGLGEYIDERNKTKVDR